MRHGVHHEEEEGVRCSWAGQRVKLSPMEKKGGCTAQPSVCTQEPTCRVIKEGDRIGEVWR